MKVKVSEELDREGPAGVVAAFIVLAAARLQSAPSI